MRNIKYKVILLLGMITLSVGCDSDLDLIDGNTTDLPTVDTKLLLTSGQVFLTTETGGTLANFGGIWSQYYTQSPGASQYQTIDEYNIDTGDTDRLWVNLYSRALPDLNAVISKSEESGDTSLKLIGTALRGYTFQLLVDLFGDVPYSEAFIDGNFTPVFDSGEDVYTGILAELDAALNDYNSNPSSSISGSNDLFYNGDMAKWVQFVNTLKLKMYMRMADTTLANSTAVQALLSENNFLSEDAANSNYSAAEGQRNPFWDVQLSRLGDVNTIASNTLFEFLNSNGDDRLASIYREAGIDRSGVGTAGGGYVGIDQGDFAAVSGTAASYSRPNLSETNPVYVMTVAESNFLQAEALVRYSGGSGAQAKYEDGIRNSFATLGADTTDLESLITGVYAYDASKALEQIAIQKWVSMANVNQIEGFFEQNRTGYPAFVTGTPNYAEGNFIYSKSSVLGAGQSPASFYYSPDALERNPNSPQQKASLMEKIWWDVN